MALRAALVEHDDLAGLDVADVFRADDFECAGFRRQDRTTVEFAEHQWPDAERVARADQLLVGQRHQRVGALDRPQRLDETVDEAAALGLGDQMQDDLGVGGGLHHRTAPHQFPAQGQAIGEVAVMADREAAGIELGKQRLHVTQDGFAGRGVADVADGGIAGQALDHLAAGEGIADKAKAAFRMEPASVEGHDARGLLAAMLQGVQSERGDRRGFRVAENAEHAAFLAQRVAFKVGVFQIEGAEIRPGSFGVVGRARFTVHRASLLTNYRWPSTPEQVLTSRGLFDQLFQAVAGRLAIPIARPRRRLISVSLLIFWFILLESL